MIRLKTYKRIASRWLRKAEVFPSQEALDAYLKEHPGADPSIHSVERQDPVPDAPPPPDINPPPDRDAPVPPGDPPPPDIDDFVDDDSIIRDVINKAKKNQSPTKGELWDAFKLVRQTMKGKEITPEELEKMKKLTKWLNDWAGEPTEEKGSGSSKSPTLKSKDSEDAPESKHKPEHVQKVKEFVKSIAKEEADAKETDKANYKKKKQIYRDDRKKVVDALVDAGLDEDVLPDIQEFARDTQKEYDANKKKYEAALDKWESSGSKGSKPEKPEDPDFHALWLEKHPKMKVPKKVFESAAGLPDKEPSPVKRKQKTPEEIKKEFIAHLKDPKDKEHFEDMDAEEFEDMLKAIRKEGSLRANTIRMAYVCLDMRPYLLNALRFSKEV